MVTLSYVSVWVNLFLAARMTNNADSHQGGRLGDWQAGQLLCRRQGGEIAMLRQFVASCPMHGIGRGKTGEVLELIPRRELGVGIGHRPTYSRAFAECD